MNFTNKAPGLAQCSAYRPSARRSCFLALIGIVGIVQGCTQFSETYHVGVTRKGSGQPMQFYRFRMKGTADWGTKTKFASAWYPADAVQAVVGEYRPSDVVGKAPSPEDALQTFSTKPAGTRAFSMTLGSSADLKGTLENCRFFVGQDVAFSASELKAVKWVEATFNVTLTDLKDKNDNTDNEYKVSLAPTRTTFKADGTLLSKLCGSQSPSAMVDFDSGTLVVEGSSWMEAPLATINAELESNNSWSVDQAGNWKGNNLKSLGAGEDVYRWSVTGGAGTNACLTSLAVDRRISSGHILGAAKGINITKPQSVNVSSGWTLVSTNHDVTIPAAAGTSAAPLNVTARLNGSMTVTLTYDELISIGMDEELLKSVTSLNKSVQWKIESDEGRTLLQNKDKPTEDIDKELDQDSRAVVREGSFAGKMQIKPNDAAAADFKVTYRHPVKEVVTDPYGFEYWVVGPEGARQSLSDQRLVIFMASDPEPMTQAIQSFATNADVQATVGALVKKMRSNSNGDGGKGARTAARIGLSVLKAALNNLPAGEATEKATDEIQKLIGNVTN